MFLVRRKDLQFVRNLLKESCVRKMIEIIMLKEGN